MRQHYKEAWIQTFTGKKFYPFDPRPEDVDLRDIAHALSLLCRFNGHSECFYSVAEHSIRASRLLCLYPTKYCPVQPGDDGTPDNNILGADLRLAVILHDAAEAYISDLPRPIKQQIPDFQELDHKISAAIAEAFEFDAELFSHPIIKKIDMAMLATELRDLMKLPTDPWMISEPPVKIEAIIPYDSKQAEKLFLDEARTWQTRLENQHA